MMHFNIMIWIHHFGYIGVFIILLLEMVGIPFPAETTLTFSGIQWTQGVFSLAPLLLAATFGNIIGSSMAYAMGRFLGHSFIVRFGKRIGITNERMLKAGNLFKKHGISIIMFSKFLAGVRVFIPYLAGINRMSFIQFSILNAISAFVWAAFFILLGRYIGIFWQHYHQLLHPYIFPFIALLILVGLGLYFKHKFSSKKLQNQFITLPHD